VRLSVKTINAELYLSTRLPRKRDWRERTRHPSKNRLSTLLGKVTPSKVNPWLSPAPSIQNPTGSKALLIPTACVCVEPGKRKFSEVRVFG
jgi:hypothetical protein